MKVPSFKEFNTLLEENELILEFANLEPEEHNFGSNLKMHVMQPGDRKLQHGPRVKFFNNEHEFSVSISKNLDDIKVIGDYTKLITTRELNKIRINVHKYHIPLLTFWNDPKMTTKALLKMMEEV